MELLLNIFSEDWVGWRYAILTFIALLGLFVGFLAGGFAYAHFSGIGDKIDEAYEKTRNEVIIPMQEDYNKQAEEMHALIAEEKEKYEALRLSGMAVGDAGRKVRK